MSENVIELTIVNLAEKDGWFQRKLEWVGRRGAPDRFFAKAGRVVLIEFKDTGKEPGLLQQREHQQLLAAGVEVHVCDSIAKAKRVLGL